MSNADFASRSDYGRCPECGGEFQIRLNGRLRTHRKPRPADRWSGYSMPTCPGSGQRPATTTEEIPS